MSIPHENDTAALIAGGDLVSLNISIPDNYCAKPFNQDRLLNFDGYVIATCISMGD